MGGGRGDLAPHRFRLAAAPRGGRSDGRLRARGVVRATAARRRQGRRIPTFLDQLFAYHRRIAPRLSSDFISVSGPGLQLLAIGRDRKLAVALAGEARRAGSTLEWSEEAVAVAELVERNPDAVLVDPGSLGAGGWAYVERLYAEGPPLNVVVCSERVSRERRVRGLREGVDDWITKPMHALEVLARLEAVARASAPAREVVPKTMEFGELLIEPQYMQARIDGENLGLTRRELDLLVTLARAHGRVVEREELYRGAWGYSMPAGDRSVDVFIRKLRQKLDHRSRRCRYIHTHFRVGYRFEAVAREGEGSAEPAKDTGSAVSIDEQRLSPDYLGVSL